jgi:hypothetical protein
MNNVRVATFAFALLLLLSGREILAVPVYINDPQTVISSFGGQIGEARFKVDSQNWDAGLGSSVGTAGSFLSSNIGTATQILGRDYTFELKNDDTAGLSFQVRNGATTVASLNWGTTSLGGFTSLARAYDTIRISVRATGNAAQARVASLTDLTFGFQGGGIYNDASGLADLLVNRSTPASTFSNFPQDAAGSDSHWIATGPMTSGTNLAAKSWRLAGGIRFDSPLPANNPNESLRLSIGLIQYNWSQLPASPTPSQVPEPETYVLTGAGLALFAFLGRRRMRAADSARR